MKKLNTKRIICAWFLFGMCILSMSFLCGCSSEINFLDLLVCGSYAVPGMFCSEKKGGCCTSKTLEVDSMGRCMFEYTAYNVILDQETTAIVICQAVDSEYVYIYEDICYLMAPSEDTLIAEFKEVNDWDKPLDESRMSRRVNSVSSDLWMNVPLQMDYNQLKKQCFSSLQISKEDVHRFEFIDIAPSGQVLYWLVYEGTDGQQISGLVLADTSYQLVFYAIPSEDITPEKITEVKHENGWVYG